MVIPDDEIKTYRKVALLEYVQKHIHEKDIKIHQNNIAWLMGTYELSKENVRSFMHYLMQKGLQEGRSERDREIARNLLSMGLNRDGIVRATGMTGSEVDALPDGPCK